MEIKRQKIKLGKLKQNTGQLDGIPKNPRQWTQLDVEKLAKSIEETPELLEMRPIIAVPKDERFVIVGGNLRFSALKLLDYKEVDCYVLEDAEISKIKEIVIKDNGSFGEWDVDMLANEWDELPLSKWGVDVSGAEVKLDYDNTEFNINDFTDLVELRLRYNDEDFNKVNKFFDGKDKRIELLKILEYNV